MVRSKSLKKNILFRGSGGHLATDANHRIIVEALRNVSMNFRAGDRVALVGVKWRGKDDPAPGHGRRL